jgi:lysophospholipase L1-like esterase
MKKLLIVLLFNILNQSYADVVYALGTSNTNCKDAGQTYTKRLSELLPNHQIINGGIDGDKPIWMLNRLKTMLQKEPNIKLVIFEPGPNDRNKASSLEATEQVLAYLKNINLKTIYVSHSLIQTPEDADLMAKKYNATYYGNWTKNVPSDREHRQFDNPLGGHMTAKGCTVWAEQMAPLIESVLTTK